MKKLVITTALALVAVAGYSQGTVNFSNVSTAYSPADASHLVKFDATAPTFNPALTPGALVTSNYNGVDLSGLRAQLYYGAASATDLASLTPVTDAPVTFRTSTSTSAGSWFGGTRTLTGFNPGDTVKLAVVVYDINRGGSASSGGSGLYGTTGLISYTAPQPGSLPAAYLISKPGFTIAPVPEPSTFALAGLGLAAVAIFRRRK